MFDAIIVGGGFKGMMTAYGLAKQGKRTLIIEREAQLGGFMEPITWNGTKIDRGPQFLDGVNAVQKQILDEIMQDAEPLSELDFSYSSYWNGVTTNNFAIPDYRHLPKQDKALLLYESMSEIKKATEASSIAELYADNQEVTYEYINRWCKKFLNTDAHELSPLNKGLVTFFGRKLLFNNEHSLYLKKSEILDEALAAEKVSISHGTFNLYPKHKTLGYFKDNLVRYLNELGIEVLSDSEVSKVEKLKNRYNVLVKKENEGIEVSASEIYFSGTIESTENILLKRDEISKYIKPVSQVFYLATLSESQNLPFYTMNYSNDSIARVTYFHDYAQAINTEEPIICIEVPTEIGSSIWKDPESHFKILENELEKMGFLNIKAYKPVKIKSTYRALLKGYEDSLSTLMGDVEKAYGSNIHILTPHILTRACIMNELMDKGIININ